MDILEVQLVGHSFLRHLKDFCADQEIFNFDFEADKIDVRFRLTLANGRNISNINGLDTFIQQCYEGVGSMLPEMVFLEIGSNDIHSYMQRHPYNPTLQDILGSQNMAHRLMGMVDRIKSAGVRAVMVGAALPRLAGGTYGAGQYLGRDPSEDALERAEDRGSRMTAVFNEALLVGCENRGERVLFCKTVGLSDGWEQYIGEDGCHLDSKAANWKLFKSIRGPIIHFSKKQ